MKDIKKLGGIFVPGQATPTGYIKLTNRGDGLPVIISAPFIVCVEACKDDEGEFTAVSTTITGVFYRVTQSFDDVMAALCGIHG